MIDLLERLELYALNGMLENLSQTKRSGKIPLLEFT
jgi:hypothetical protein